MARYQRAPTTPSHAAQFEIDQPEVYEMGDPYDRIPSRDSTHHLNPSFRPYHLSPPQTPRVTYGKSGGFEKPHWSALWVHLIACGLAWPILYLFVLVGQNKSLFVVRLVVGMGCGIVGFVLGLSLLGLGQRYLEATTWATIIHQSVAEGGAQGMRLRDLEAHSGDPTSAFIALRVLWNRFMQTGTTRKARSSYDKRPWSLFILLFLLIVSIASLGPFALGRIVNINTQISQQFETYEEILVKGDLSEADVQRARESIPAFDSFLLTWTLSPFSVRSTMPGVVSLPWEEENDNVYFSETTRHQLDPNGAGFGTFVEMQNATATDLPEINSTFANEVRPGTVLRYPRWGLRIHCERLPDPEINIVAKSPNTFTYQFIPRSVLENLFSSFKLDLPDFYKKPFDPSKVLRLNDTMPPGVDVNSISLGTFFHDNGVAHSLKSDPYSMGEDGKGWVSIESVMLRLNQTYAPNGKFGRMSDASMPDEKGNPTRIGYDSVVCLELFEPWITQTTAPSFGLPTTDRIIAKGTSLDNTAGIINGKRLDGPRTLHSTNKSEAYIVAHQNSVNQILKDNGRDAFYVPSPTSVSFTDGEGAFGYTELSASKFAHSRALADASNILPYLAGTGDLVARSFHDKTTSSARIEPRWMGVFLGVYVILGLIGAFCVPKLPLGVPRRGFEVYSWLAAFKKDEVMIESSQRNLKKGMSLEEMADVMGDIRLRYVV